MRIVEAPETLRDASPAGVTRIGVSHSTRRFVAESSDGLYSVSSPHTTTLARLLGANLADWYNVLQLGWEADLQFIVAERAPKMTETPKHDSDSSAASPTPDVAARMEVLRGDITTLDVDAIVNAANSSLMGGGGVDGAIHRAAGRELVAECRTLGRCPTGEARITHGYRLPARWVIHTVGPVWGGGAHNEDALLASCYRNSLTLAAQHGLRSVAFPAISTGIYGFPMSRAIPIALGETRRFLASDATIERVIFVCFSDDDYEDYRRALADAN